MQEGPAKLKAEKELASRQDSFSSEDKQLLSFLEAKMDLMFVFVLNRDRTVELIDLRFDQAPQNSFPESMKTSLVSDIYEHRLPDALIDLFGLPDNS